MLFTRYLPIFLFYFYLISKACNHYVEARHAIFLASILGDVATIATTSVIIGMDFLLNIYHGLRIVHFIKKKKASPSDDNSKFMIIDCLCSQSMSLLFCQKGRDRKTSILLVSFWNFKLTVPNNSYRFWADLLHKWSS